MAIIETGALPAVGYGSNPERTLSMLGGDHWERMTQIVVNRFEAAENACRARFERFYRWEKLVHMVTKKKQYEWKSNVALPYALSMTEQAAATKHESMFGSRPFVTVRPRSILRDPMMEDLASRRQALIDYHLTSGSEAESADFAPDSLRCAERYGKAVLMVSPAWETKQVRYRAREFHPTALGPVSRVAWKLAEKKRYSVDVVNLDLTDFFPQPNVRRINGPGGMRWCFFRSWRVLEELEEMEAAGLLGAEVNGRPIAEVKDTQEQDTNEYKIRRMFLGRYEDATRFHDDFDKTIELIDAYMVVPKESLEPEVAAAEEQAGLDPTKRWIVVANRGKVIQDVALPWHHGMWPFVEMDSMKDPYDFYGKGSVEPIEHLSYVANEIVNMRQDNVKAAVNRMIGIAGDRMPAGWKRRLLTQPYGVIDTGSADPKAVIAALDLPDVTSSSYAEQQQLFTLVQEARGINETMLGAPGPERTLGEHQLKAAASTRRLRFEVICQSYQLFSPPYGLAGFFVALDCQYMPLPFYTSLIKPGFPDDMMRPVEIDEDVLAADDRDFIVVPTGATEGIDKFARRQDLAEMLKMLEPMAEFLVANGFDLKQLVDTVMRTFDFQPMLFWPEGQGMTGPDAQGTMSGPGMPGAPVGAMPGAGRQSGNVVPFQNRGRGGMPPIGMGGFGG